MSNNVFRGMMSQSTDTPASTSNNDQAEALKAYKVKYPDSNNGLSNPLAPGFDWYYKNEWSKRSASTVADGRPQQVPERRQQAQNQSAQNQSAQSALAGQQPYGFEPFDQRIGGADGYYPGHLYSIRSTTAIPQGWTIAPIPDSIRAKYRPTKSNVTPGRRAVQDIQEYGFDSSDAPDGNSLPLAYNRSEVFKGATTGGDPREGISGWITEDDPNYRVGIFMPQSIAESGDPDLIEAFIAASPYSGQHAGGRQGKPNDNAVAFLQTRLARQGNERAAEQMAQLRFLDPAFIEQIRKNTATTAPARATQGTPVKTVQPKTAQPVASFLQSR